MMKTRSAQVTATAALRMTPSSGVSKMKIRRKDDISIKIEDISKMSKEEFRSFTDVWKKSFNEQGSFPISMKKLKGMELLIARDRNGKIVGGSLLSRWVHDLCVDPECQGKGIGGKMLKYLQQRGNVTLQVDKTEPSSENLKEFYMKNKFKKSHECYDSYEFNIQI